MNMQQTDIFSLFGIEDEYAEKKKREEEERMKQQAELQKKMEEAKKNGTSAAAKKEEFEVNANTVIYFYTEVIDINDYFTAEELEFGIAKKKNGEIQYKKITENDVKNRLKKDYPVLEAGAELVYINRKNIISVILKAKKKGISSPKESNTDSFAASNRKIPFRILRDFISIAKYFTDSFGSEVHADIFLNVDTGEFFMDIPEQQAHPLWVEVTEDPHTTVEKFMDLRHIKVMEIHSHHNMPPIPSTQDDESERMPLLYAIVGNIYKFFPDISVRTFDMKRERHINLDPWQIFENPFDTLPSQFDLTVVEVVK